MASVSSITDFASLKIAVADFLDRTDLVTAIPLFIQLAEKDMEQKLRHYRMVIKSYANGQANDGAIALPTDWLEARNIEVDDEQISYQSPDVLDMYRNTNPETTGAPLYYSYYGPNLEIWPVPTEDFTVEMDYYQTIPPLADSIDGTNWILTASPGAYLYGALIHSAPYLKDDDRIPVWEKLHMDSLIMLQNKSDEAMTSGSRLSRKCAVTLG